MALRAPAKAARVLTHLQCFLLNRPHSLPLNHPRALANQARAKTAVGAAAQAVAGVAIGIEVAGKKYY